MRPAAIVFVVLLCLPLAAQKGTGRNTAKQSQQSRTTKPSQDEPILPGFNGTVRGLDSKLLLLERPDSNTIEFHCSKKTKYYDGAKQVKVGSIQPGDQVVVEAQHALDGTLDAVTVRLQPRNNKQS